MCERLSANGYKVRGAVRGVTQMTALSLGVEGVQVGDIGLLTVQILQANGCRVMGVDFDGTKFELARRFVKIIMVKNT